MRNWRRWKVCREFRMFVTYWMKCQVCGKRRTDKICSLYCEDCVMIQYEKEKELQWFGIDR